MLCIVCGDRGARSERKDNDYTCDVIKRRDKGFEHKGCDAMWQRGEGSEQ